MVYRFLIIRVLNEYILEALKDSSGFDLLKRLTILEYESFMTNDKYKHSKIKSKEYW